MSLKGSYSIIDLKEKSDKVMPRFTLIDPLKGKEELGKGKCTVLLIGEVDLEKQLLPRFTEMNVDTLVLLPEGPGYKGYCIKGFTQAIVVDLKSEKLAEIIAEEREEYSQPTIDYIVYAGYSSIDDIKFIENLYDQLDFLVHMSEDAGIIVLTEFSKPVKGNTKPISTVYLGGGCKALNIATAIHAILSAGVVAELVATTSGFDVVDSN